MLLLCAITFQACRSSQTNENKDVSHPGETANEFPFSTTEPEVYQGDLVTSYGTNETRIFVARKGDKWRYDIFRGPQPWRTQLNTDKLYTIDHRGKIYFAEAQSEDSTTAGGVFGGLTSDFFRGKQYREFEELGREGNLIEYKVSETAGSKGSSLIFIDAASGMMVRQEFIGQTDEAGSPLAFIYEIRNLKFEVDDSVFRVPEGYRQVTREEFRAPAKQKL